MITNYLYNPLEKIIKSNYALLQILFVAWITFVRGNTVVRKNTNEEEAKQFLQDYNQKYGHLLNNFTLASWNYETNLTNQNEETMTQNKLKVCNEETSLSDTEIRKKL